MTDKAEVLEGARNLLVNCAEVQPGESLLVVEEDPALGWYDREVPSIIAEEAGKLGLAVDRLTVGAPTNNGNAAVTDAVARHDCTIFFARLGDQDRFGALPPGTRSVMSYVRDPAMLASAYGRVEHQALVAVKEAVNVVTLGAERIEIRCPLGTAISGTRSAVEPEGPADVSVRRFPLGVPQPIDASSYSGQVALARYLTPTGSGVYDPACLPLPDVVMAQVEAGRIVGFEGSAETVARVREHYARVSDTFGIDPDVVHSWHAGIHPACAYDPPAGDDPDRWSNSVFTHPRFLHFHTCGGYAPGEISWNLLDHSVLADGVALWDQGRLQLQAFAQTAACAEAWPSLAAHFARPSERIGLPAEA